MFDCEFCVPLSCLSLVDVVDDEVVVGEGFSSLVYYLRNPIEMGYIAYSVQLNAVSGFPFHESHAICARSANKAVFRVQLTDSHPCMCMCMCVVKAFRYWDEADS